MGTFAGTDYGDEVIFKQVRHCKNTAYNYLNPSATKMPDAPIPSFGAYDGFWNTTQHGSNTKYDGYIDFNYKDCTGGDSHWKIKFLLGQSEFPANQKVGNYTTGDAPGYPNRDGNETWKSPNWMANNADKNSPDEHGTGFEDLFNINEPGVAYYRKKNNLSRCFIWGHIDSPLFDKSNHWVKYDHSKDRQAHYTRAKGITFRYDLKCKQESGTNWQDEWHGTTPLFQFGLLFTKTDWTKDHYLYYAEMIAAEDRIAKEHNQGAGAGGATVRCHNSADFFPEGDQWRPDPHRMILGKVSHKFDYEVKAKHQVKNPEWNEGDDPESEYISKISSKPGFGPWDEMGPYAHQRSYFNQNYGYEVQGFPPDTPKRGVCALTITKRAAEFVWDNDMVCVGFLCHSSHTSRQAGFVGSDAVFKMYAPKILEQESRGDNELVMETPDFEPGYDIYSNIMRPKCKVRDCNEHLVKTRTKAKDYFPKVDLIV